MNKRLGLYASLAFVLFVFLGVTLILGNVNTKRMSADSGFDSSWDSGESSSSSSHESSFSDREGGTGLFGIPVIGDVLAYVIGFFIFVILVAIYTVLIAPLFREIRYLFSRKKNYVSTSLPPEEKANQHKNKYNLSQIYNVQDIEGDKLELLKSYGLTLEEVKEESYKIYVNVQEAWSNNDIEKAKDILGNALYNQYKAQIKGLKAKKQRNVMSDFNFEFAKVADVKEKNNSLSIKVILSVSCIDYLASIDKDTVLRGSSSDINFYVYSLWFLVSKKEEELINCPNCNAEITLKGSNVKCEFCGANIDRKTHNMILCDKKMLHQT